MSPTRVRTEVFLREDIQNVLRAISSANRALAARLPIAEVTIYRAGFNAAMQAVAEAFDVILDSPFPGSDFQHKTSPLINQIGCSNSRDC